MLFQSRKFLTWITFIFFFIQLFCTITNKNIYPFCSYNMFNRTFFGKYKQFEVRLINSLKNDSISVPAYKIIPIEYFRADYIMYNIYYSNDEKKKYEFSKAILDNLKYNPWTGFDEIYGSIKYNNYTQMKVCVYEYIIDDKGLSTKDFMVIYLYKMK